MHENTVARGHANRAAIGRADLKQFLLQRMPDDGFDRAETNCAIFQAEAKHLTEAFAAQLVNASVRSLTLQAIVDERTNAHHAHAAFVFYENMIVPIHAHDNDAVIAQLVDVEIIAPDATAERRDQRTDFGGSEHFVEARLLNIENFALERQDRLRAPIAALLRGAAAEKPLDETQLGSRGG